VYFNTTIQAHKPVHFFPVVSTHPKREHRKPTLILYSAWYWTQFRSTSFETWPDK